MYTAFLEDYLIDSWAVATAVIPATISTTATITTVTLYYAMFIYTTAICFHVLFYGGTC